jgi:quinoprotein glucose dehydrogenase
MPRNEPRRPVNAFAYWATVALGLLMVLLGLLLGAGGVWLATLGGSWYYLLAGIGLVASGLFIMRGRLLGLWLYLLTYLGTLVWALWEAGFDGWAQVPRLVAPTIILILVLLTIPVLRRLDHKTRGWRSEGAVAATLVLAVGGLSMLALPWIQPARVIAQVPATGEPVAPDDLGATEAEEAPAAEEPLPEASAPGAASGASQPDELAPAETPVPPLAEEPVLPEVPGTEEPEAAAGARPATAMAEPGSDWPAYGGSIHATRYSPLDQINAENVGQLTRIWEYRTGDLPEEGEDYAPETTPLKIGNRLFLCSALNILIAVEASTGKEEWRHDPVVPSDAIPYSASCRGVAYYEDPEAEDGTLCATRVIEGTIDARLIAVDAELGTPCSDFGLNGQIDLEEGLGETVPGWYAVTSPPVIVRGVVITGAQVTDGNAEDSPSGVIRGYDAVTGELVWAWDLGNPDLTGAPPEGSVYTRGTPNMWTIAAGDEELGHVYLPMGNSAVDYYGSNRSEAENEYATALVALDVTTGQPVWHFQTVHRDVWDYDLGSQPSLVEFPGEDGGTVPAIVLASKQGDIYILDRRTGESLFPVEERPVPQGGVEPDYLSPTQPFSLYHTLAFPPLEEKDMWGMSPLDQLWCRIQYRQAHYEGLYTPPTTETHWIQYPGYNGGNDWGSVAVDEQRGILIANYNNMPNYNRLVPREEVDRLGVAPINAPAMSEDAPEDIAPQVGAPYGIDVNAGWRIEFTGLMCKEPPYGGIRAIDLATGETLWDRPLGTARANGPFRIPSMLPFDIGTPNNGGPVITAGGLVFIGAATDDLIRAIDIETGETVWQDVLPAGGQATPMVYEEDGRQFVAIFAGGHHFMETPIGDYLIAYGLPGK